MSTGALYTFKDAHSSWNVYKHHGYPSGAAVAIVNGLLYAWMLPRFEADEFAAAFIAGNKSRYINKELAILRELEGIKERSGIAAVIEAMKQRPSRS
jgi:hypothetical protein